MKARTVLIRSAIFGAACSALFGQYTYYYTDPLTSINGSNWTTNGSGLSAGTGGLTDANSTGGSLISKVAGDGSSAYEVNTTLTLTQSGGTYVTYLRGSTNALSVGTGSGSVGTTYSFEVQNPTFNGSACSATLAGYKIVSGNVTALSSAGIVCHTGMTIRAVYTKNSNQILVFVDNYETLWAQDATITSGQPGVGVRGAPSANSIALVKLGGIYAGAPAMPAPDEIGVSAFANKVEIQWPGASEPNGPGVAYYPVYRNGTWLTTIGLADLLQGYEDSTVSPSTTYSYYITACDYDLNCAGDTITVVTPPAGAIDPRETGIRPTGSYWGGAGEQIDMRSGNLNYTTPILKVMGRGGWGVGFNLTYNSQNWRQDGGGTWQLGQDVGYGYGWKLLAGSLLPFNSPSGYGEWLFTDATGAQYHLNQNTGGVWTSTESIYVSYDSNTDKLHFNDGSFWSMGCVSAGTEWDAGTKYPTLMEDSNGNQVIISYNAGAQVTWGNSSSRIASIQDVRAFGAPDYTFTYNTDTIPHLTGITNSIGTAENYLFAYTANYPLTAPPSPFNGQAFGTVTLLQSSKVINVPLTTYFTYDNPNPTSSCSSPGTGTSGPGELTQVTTPYCGHLRWTYTSSNTLSGSRTYREVLNRYLSMSSGTTETTIQLTRGNDSGNTVHSSATLSDPAPANAQKVWTFQTAAGFNLGLETSYEELTLSSGTALSLLNFTWAQTPTSLNPYIGTTVTKLDPGQTYENDKQTVQTLDQYGNLTQMQVYNFGAPGGGVGSLARTYTNGYWIYPDYASLYILNRLSGSSVSDGTNMATLVSNSYDQGMLQPPVPPPAPYTLYEFDTNLTTTVRGNVTSSTTPTATTSYVYNIGGSVNSTIVNGVTSSVTTAQSSNFAVPTQVQTNTLPPSSMNWNSFLGLTSASGPNGDTGSIGYDGNARPSSVTSPYGAITTYAYDDTASPPNKVATTKVTPTSVGHWVETVFDGSGRTIQTTTGTGTTTSSIVDTQYAPCGCSPLGKLWRQSQPYAPGGSDAWTTYTYDASGRTTSVALPDGSTTSYVYQGNTVKVSDPAGKWKTFTMDAFGNLTSVLEYDPVLFTNVTTNYTYDVLNHLTKVSMPRGSATQTRTFNYNTGGTTVTGFLQSATNPENGTVTYTYNTQYPYTNTLASKTDAKGQNFTYQYDSYNRLTSLTHTNATNGPVVLHSYMYDVNNLDSTFSGSYTAGRLVAVTNSHFTPGNGAQVAWIQMVEMYGYTRAGSVSGKRLQVIENTNVHGGGSGPGSALNLDAIYTYDNEGKVNTVKYPTTSSGPGSTYTYAYDNMSRPITLTDQNNVVDVNSVTYNAANQLLTIGGTIAASENRTYNNLGQLTQLNDLHYNFPAGANNGKISSMYNATSGETISYQYDSLNRLISASGSGGSSGNWGDAYGFDSFGSLVSKTPSGSTGPPSGSWYVDANNHLGNQDANGNQGGYGYDAENRLKTAGTAQYSYDSQNKRVWAGTLDAPLGNLTSQTASLYGIDGQKLGTYSFFAGSTLTDGPVSLSVYFGSKHVATIAGGVKTPFAADRLGSNANDSLYPWGEDRGTPGPNDQVKFATYTRDSATLLDYANNRYYSNAYGRFMTPDPYQSSGGPADPQSWNRYAYTTGDPVNWVDSQGLFQECPACSIYNSDSTTVVQTFSSPYSNGYGTLNMNQIIAQAIAQAYANYQQLLGSALTASEARVAQDLAKPECAKDFKNTSADLNKLSTIGFSNYGAPQFVTNGRGQIVPAGQGFLRRLSNPCFNSYACYNPFTKSINLNLGIAWLDPTQQQSTLNGQPYTTNDLAAEAGIVNDNVSGNQFMDITILHELSHFNGAIGSPDNDAVELKLWKDCLK